MKSIFMYSIFFLLTLIVLTGILPAGIQGERHISPEEIEPGDSFITLHLPLLTAENGVFLALQDLSRKFNWKIEQDNMNYLVEQNAKKINLQNKIDNDITDGEIILLDNEPAVCPELASYLIKNLEEEEYQFISWLFTTNKYYKENQPVEYSLHILNLSTRTQELYFPTGQNYELILSGPATSWNITAERPYRQIVRNIEVASREHLSWQGEFSPKNLSPGSYILTSSLSSQPAVIFNSYEFEIIND